MATTAEQIRQYRGPALFSLGFRPFFLGAALWSAFAVLLWIVSLAQGHSDLGGRAGLLWHQDEMVFGMLAGVIAGFLLTAVPNWTGRLPVVGVPLVLLFSLWAAGRLASVAWDELGLAAIIVDVSFLFVLAAALWREVLAGKNTRNIPVCVMVTLLGVAHLVFHLRESLPSIADLALRLALAAVAGLIALIGGRIVPSFARNWLAARGDAANISAQPDLLDKAALAIVALALAAWVVAPVSAVSGAGMVVAGLALLVRLSRWRTLATGPEPLVWILHAGYAWLGFALLAIGAGALDPFLVPPTAGIHALTAGAAAVMVLAVMTRASLGHTGRALSAGWGTRLIYVFANLAAVVRFAAPFFSGGAQITLLTASAALWAVAFVGFALVYGPFLMSPRVPKAGEQ